MLSEKIASFTFKTDKESRGAGFDEADRHGGCIKQDVALLIYFVNDKPELTDCLCSFDRLLLYGILVMLCYDDLFTFIRKVMAKLSGG